MENPLSTFWNKNKIFFKSFLIGILMLLLLIPNRLIQDLITERSQRQQEAVSEINSRWAGPQSITAPVIGIPYTETVIDGKDNHDVKKWAYFLPGKLKMHASIVPEIRYRGIYQVIVYTTEINVNGSYDSLAIKELGIDPAKLHFNEATIFFDLSDMHGLKEDVVVHIGNAQRTDDIELSPAKVMTEQFKSALSASLPVDLATNSTGLNFSSTIKLKGSGSLQFIPTGRETKVDVSPPGPTPASPAARFPMFVL